MDEDVEALLEKLRGGEDDRELLYVLDEDQMREWAAALRDEDERIRQRALQALARTRNSYALDAIMCFYQDSSPRIRAAALQACADQGGDSDPLSLQTFGKLLLQDPDIEMRRRAATALGLIHTDRARAGLETALQDRSLPADLRAIVEAQLATF